jgi:chemotaxis protein MotB
MSETNNPFAGTEKPKEFRRGLVIAWSVASVAIVAALILGAVMTRLRANHAKELTTAREKLESTSASLAGALDSLRTNQEAAAQLSSRIAELQKEKEQVGTMARNLEDEMRHELESKDVTISKLQGKLTVSIVDRVMFDSGEAILKPDGAAVMKKIADLLAAHPELKIHVIGHTDNVPIRQTAHSRFASNWELSAARALAAVHFLTENAGVDPKRVGAVAYGEFRPIAENITAEGRAKNRRIAITILPDELAGADLEAKPVEQISQNANIPSEP